MASEPATMDFKPAILRELDTMRKADIARKKVFPARAYKKVMDALEGTNKPIRTMEDVKTIPGIGEKIEEKIKEIKEQYPKMKYGEYDPICYIQKGKVNIRENALGFMKEGNLMETTQVYLNQQDANYAYSNSRR